MEYMTQPVSRDLLAEAMLRLKGCRIVGHVHDEVIIEASDGEDLKDICRIMAEPPEWMPDIRLRADGYECEWYRKE